MKYLSSHFIRKNSSKFVVLAISLFMVFCSNGQSKNRRSVNKVLTANETENYNIQYDLSKPTRIIDLPGELMEISGLSYYTDNKLVCQHDEKEDLFVIDYLSCEIISKKKSGKSGDYEGVEQVNGSVFLLKSNGTITEYSNFNTNQQKRKSYKTKISQKNDAEGLGYDPKTNSLLIACKSKPSLKDAENKFKSKRCIYRFSLDENKLKEVPFIYIDLEKMEREYGKKHFMPSAIAYNPIDENFYVLSAVGNHLIVVDRNSNILKMEKLAPSLFMQPEGICFSPDGKFLFISNEGKMRNANILVFDRRTNN